MDYRVMHLIHIYIIILSQYRHSEPKLRPKFMEVVKSLNQPDFKILEWSQDDLKTYDKNAMTLGSPLREGKYLFTELQQTYQEETLVPFL